MPSRKKAAPQAPARQSIPELMEAKRRRLALRDEIFGLARRLIMVAFGVWLLFFVVFGFGVVRGQGMYPRLSDGDLAFYYRLEKNFAVDDVLAFRQNDKLTFGRIVAMPGDTVSFSEDGQLVVNGNTRQEEVFFATTVDGRATEYPVTLAEHEVFVLGDDRPFAVDSRDFGAVNLEEIEGVVLCIFRNRGL